MDYFGIPCYASPSILKENVVYHTDVDIMLYCSVLESYVTFHIKHEDDFDKYFSLGKGFWPESYEGVYWNKLPYIPILVKAGADYSFTGTATLRVVYFPLVMDYGTVEQIPSIAGTSTSTESGSTGNGSSGTGEDLPITTGTVVFDSNVPGSYTIVIPMEGDYRITAVGGGGGGAVYMYCYKGLTYWYGQAAGGGAGGYFDGVYTLSSGALDLTVAGAGAGATAQWVNKNSRDTSGFAIGGNGGTTAVGGFLEVNGGHGGQTSYKTATAGTSGSIEYATENLVETYILKSGDRNAYGNAQVVAGTSVTGSVLNVTVSGGTCGVPDLHGAGGGASGTASFVYSGRTSVPSASTTSTGGNNGYIRIVKM